jgi:hypothetical protein
MCMEYVGLLTLSSVSLLPSCNLSYLGTRPVTWLGTKTFALLSSFITTDFLCLASELFASRLQSLSSFFSSVYGLDLLPVPASFPGSANTSPSPWFRYLIFYLEFALQTF